MDAEHPFVADGGDLNISTLIQRHDVGTTPRGREVDVANRTTLLVKNAAEWESTRSPIRKAALPGLLAGVDQAVARRAIRQIAGETVSVMGRGLLFNGIHGRLFS